MNKNINKTEAQSALRIIVTAAVLFSIFTTAARAAASWEQKEKLVPLDIVAGEQFGLSVSISGDNAIAGAPSGKGNVNLSGSAYIFNRDWGRQSKLIAADGHAEDCFGSAVSLSGDYAIVAAERDDDKGEDSGSAYIFKQEGTSWGQQAKLTAADANEYDQFGDSVSISGDWAIVGAYGDNVNSGSAYLFKRDGTVWSQQVKLLASDGNDKNFGFSVSIDGDYAIVGAVLGRGNASMSGVAYIFIRDGNNWNRQARIFASDGDAGDYFGWSVSISGGFAIVGARGDDYSKGSAYIFKRDGTSWSQQAKLLASDGIAEDKFGISVSIDGDFAIAGAANNLYYTGEKAYIFKQVNGIWNEQQILTASGGTEDNLFGWSVSISGSFAFVGAFLDDNKGAAYIFERFCPPADINNDCIVDFTDLATLANWWLYGTD